MRRVVVADANVLINLMHVGRLAFCGGLPDHEFVIPDHVREEITRDVHRGMLDDAVARGMIRIEPIVELETLTLFAELIAYLARGEAACLAMAVRNDWLVASDEKRRFRREAGSRLGKDRVLGTAELFVLAIRAGLLTVEEADADKMVLEQRRFTMPFRSFRDLL